MALTEAQIDKAVEFTLRKIDEDPVEVNNIRDLVRWMIENPLPTKAEYQDQIAAWEEEAKAAKIASLQAQLDELQGA
jgi:hypothetical protein